MTMAPATSYTRMLARESAKPIFVWLFDGISTRFSTDYLHVLAGTATPQENVMREPTGGGVQATPTGGRVRRSRMQLKITNRDGAWEETMRGNVLLQRQGTLYIGYDEIGDADWLPIYSGEVTGLRQGSKGLEWILTVSDLLALMKADVMAKADIETEWVGTKAWDYDAVNYDLFYPDMFRLHIEDWGDKGYRAIVIDNPYRMILKMLMSSGGANPGAHMPGPNGAYDVYPDWAGLDLDSTQVDATQWEAEISANAPALVTKAVFDDTINVLKFAEEEITAIFGGYIFAGGDGRINLRIYAPPLPADVPSLVVLADDDLIQVPLYDCNYPALVTQVEYRGDYGEMGDPGGYQTTWGPWTSPVCAASPARYARAVPQKIESRLLKTYYRGASLARSLADQLFRRFQDPPPRVKLVAKWPHHITEPGDVVALQHTVYPDAELGTAKGEGATRYLEAFSRGMALGKSVTLDTLDIGYNLGATRLAGISSAGYTKDYGASGYNTDYGHLADAATGPPITMQNGDAPYYHC